MEMNAFLKNNCDWSGLTLINPSDLRCLFKKNNYYPSNELIKFIATFYNLQISFPKSDIDFRVKKVLSDYPHKYFFDQFCRVSADANPTPFAEINDGHMVLIATADNHIYGVFDDFTIDFGDNYFGMLKRLYETK